MLPKQSILHALLFTPTSRGWGAPGLLWGAPGVAKTSVIRQLASAVNAPCEVLSPGERGEGAFGVVPVPSGADADLVLRYPRPDWTVAIGSFGIVFADEITTAPPAVQPALLALALDGRIGGYTLPARVRIIAAANPVECASNGYELPPANANRFVHIPWSVDVADVCAYLMSGSNGEQAAIDAEAEEKRVMSLWSEAHARAAGKIVAFLTRHPDLLHKMPNEGDPARGKAWPSPRSWEMATRLLASSSVHALTDSDRDVVCSGCVGDAAWNEFLTYMASMDLPDPAEVLDGAAKWAPDAQRLDITAAVLSACTALVAPKDAAKRDARAAKLWEVLGAVGEAGAMDLTITPARTLIQAKLGAAPAARKVLAAQQRAGMAAALGGA